VESSEAAISTRNRSSELVSNVIVKNRHKVSSFLTRCHPICLDPAFHHQNRRIGEKGYGDRNATK
jgi:hypothetical protein